MIDFYFITGFLGAGKTTFIKNFVQFFKNKKIAIIVNEFGKTGVDGQLLSTLNAVVSEISNGSIMCSCRIFDFEIILRNVIEQTPDIIIVEASGLTDPTNIKKFLLNSEEFSCLNYRGCLCLVDVANFTKVLKTTVVSRKQLAVADIVIINKIDLAVNNDVIKNIEQQIFDLYHNIDIVNCTYGQVDDSIFELLLNRRCNRTLEIEDNYHTQDITLKKYLLTISDEISPYTFKKLLEQLALEALRIKGFARLADNKIYLVDCVQNIISLEMTDEKVDENKLQKIVILAGKGMQTSTAINTLKKIYGKFIFEIEK